MKPNESEGVFSLEPHEQSALGRPRFEVEVPFHQAQELVVRAEQQRLANADRDPSVYPAGANRERFRVEQQKLETILKAIIEEATPYLPSVADGVEQFLRDTTEDS